MYEAADAGDVTEVSRILQENPKVNVNWKNGSEFAFTPLHAACSRGHGDVVSVLLAHPDINLNLKSDHGWTPFLMAFSGSKQSCVRLLLRDHRIKNLNEPDNEGHPPLYWAAYGYLDLVKLWIVSGRKMDLGRSGNQSSDVIRRAETLQKTAVASLLKRFKANPQVTRYEVGLELGFSDEMAAEVFALVVFLCDGLLELEEEKMTATGDSRFFRIARMLPMELQMELCNRLVGSMKMGIALEKREAAFRSLAKTYKI